MVRSGDGVDFGIWNEIPPSKLIIPLDTHTARICRHISLTKRKNADWKMAKEITENLKSLDPDDPVKYDLPFAISASQVNVRQYHQLTNAIIAIYLIYACLRWRL